MFDEWIVPLVVRHDMKRAARIGKHGAAKIVSKAKIERIPARRTQANQLHGGGILQQPFDQGSVKLGLARAQQQGKVEILDAKNGKIQFVIVFEIHKDMIYGGRQFMIFREHKIMMYGEEDGQPSGGTKEN